MQRKSPAVEKFQQLMDRFREFTLEIEPTAEVLLSTCPNKRFINETGQF